MTIEPGPDQPSPAPPPPPPPGRVADLITTDTKCLKCEYDLRGLALDAACPECGTAVAVSVKSPTGAAFAIASLVLGIISIVSVVGCWFIGVVPGILAMVFAHVAKNRVISGMAHPSSLGMATAGRICGIIGIALALAYLVLIFAMAIVGGF